MYNLNGKVALVTGAGGEHGIGRAICQRLAREGCDLVVNDLHAQPYSESGWGGLPALVAEIEAAGQQALAVEADVSDAAQVEGMVQDALARFGRIDLLVNNAGSRPGPDRVPVVDLSEAAWDQVQTVNVKGTFLCSRAVARHLIDRGDGGKIINMASTAGRQGIRATPRTARPNSPSSALPNPSPASLPPTGSTSTPSVRATPSPSALTTSPQASPSATNQTPTPQPP